MAKLSSKKDPAERGELIGSGAVVPHGPGGSRRQEQFVRDASELLRLRTLSEYDEVPTADDLKSSAGFAAARKGVGTPTVRVERKALLEGMAPSRVFGPLYDGFLPGWVPVGGVPPPESTPTVESLRNVVSRVEAKYVSPGVKEALTEEEIFAPRTDFAMYRWPTAGNQRAMLAEAGALPENHAGFFDLLPVESKLLAESPVFRDWLSSGYNTQAGADRNMRRLSDMREAVGNAMYDAWSATKEGVKSAAHKTGGAIVRAGKGFDTGMKASGVFPAALTKIYDNQLVRHPWATVKSHPKTTIGLGIAGAVATTAAMLYDSRTMSEADRAVAAVANRPGGVNSRRLETLAEQMRNNPGEFLSGSNRVERTAAYLQDVADAVMTAWKDELTAYGSTPEDRDAITKDAARKYAELYEAARQSSPENGSEEAFNGIIEFLGSEGHNYTPSGFAGALFNELQGRRGQ